MREKVLFLVLLLVPARAVLPGAEVLQEVAGPVIWPACWSPEARWPTSCSLTGEPIAGGVGWVLLSSSLSCEKPLRPSSDEELARNPDAFVADLREVCYTVWDPSTGRVLGEVRRPASKRPIPIGVVGEGRPRGLLVYSTDGVEWWDIASGRVQTHWDGGFLSNVRGYHQVVLLEEGVRPAEPLRLAVLRPEGPNLIEIYELTASGSGQVRRIREFVPRATWKKLWIETYRVRDRVREETRAAGIWTLLWPTQALERYVEARVEGEIRGALLYPVRSGRLYMTTGDPLSLTEVDPQTGAFQMIPLPEAIAGPGPVRRWVVQSITPDPTGGLWILVEGVVIVEEAEFREQEPQGNCAPVFGRRGQCAFGLQALLHRGPRDEVRGWLLQEGFRMPASHSPFPPRGWVLGDVGDGKMRVVVSTFGENGRWTGFQVVHWRLAR